MNLRAFLATMSVFMLSHPLFCIPSNTSELLEESYKFSIQNPSKNTDYIKAVLEKFNKFYDELESNEDPAVWDFDFKYDPFLNKKNFGEVQHDPEIQRYVQHLKGYLEEKVNELRLALHALKANERVIVNIFQYLEIVDTMQTVIVLFDKPTLAEQTIRFFYNIINKLDNIIESDIVRRVLGVLLVTELLVLGGMVGVGVYTIGPEIAPLQKLLGDACDKAINEAFDTK